MGRKRPASYPKIVTALTATNLLIKRGEAFANGDASVANQDRMDFPANAALAPNARLMGVLLNAVGAAAGPLSERAEPADRLIEAGTVLNPDTRPAFIRLVGAAGLNWLGAREAFSPDFVAALGLAIDISADGALIIAPV